jgi:inositol oxygenase
LIFEQDIFFLLLKFCPPLDYVILHLKFIGRPDWYQLVGLLHDMGKIIFALGGTEEDGQLGIATGSQWGLSGDTWVVGCKIPDCVVYPQFNCLNPDYNDSRYNTELGMYEPNCGLDNLLFTYGHDEYMYQMLVSDKI